MAHVAAGLAAAVGHFYALVGAVVAARQPRGTTRRSQTTASVRSVLGRLYLPSAAPPPSTIAALPHAAHQFLQYDVWILVAAFVPYAYFLVAPVVRLPFWVVVPCLLTATVALGPGALLAFAYALRWHLS